VSVNYVLRRTKQFLYGLAEAKVACYISTLSKLLLRISHFEILILFCPLYASKIFCIISISIKFNSCYRNVCFWDTCRKENTTQSSMKAMDIEKHYWSFYSISKWNHSHEWVEFYTNFHSSILEQETFLFISSLFWTAFTVHLASIKDFKNMWSYPDSHPVGKYWSFS